MFGSLFFCCVCVEFLCCILDVWLELLLVLCSEFHAIACLITCLNSLYICNGFSKQTMFFTLFCLLNLTTISHTTDVETFGNVTLEALSSGCPAVVEKKCGEHLVEHGRLCSGVFMPFYCCVGTDVYTVNMCVFFCE